MYDVIIVGAGPAGTMAAFDLVKNGYHVAIVDKNVFPRKKACAGGLTPKALKLYPYDISGLFRQVCKKIHIKTSEYPDFFIEHHKALCYMVDRVELDNFSLRKTVENGAVFITGRVTDVIEEKDKVLVTCSDQTIQAKYMIGADGANSIVRRCLFGRPDLKKQFALEADLSIHTSKDVPMTFDFSYAPKGYFWIFPKKASVNIGMFSVDPSYRCSLEQLRVFAKDHFNRDAFSNVKGHPICTHGDIKSIASRRILLTGEAGGCAEPLLGEGLYFALKSGLLAAQAIHRSQTSGLPADFIYKRRMQPVFMDLGLYNKAGRWFYDHRSVFLKALSLKAVHKPFAYGYAHGLTLSETVSFPIFRHYYKNKVSKM